MMNLNWNSLNDFLAMGGQGLYVWGSLGVFAACLVGEGVALARRRQAVLSRTPRLQRWSAGSAR